MDDPTNKRTTPLIGVSRRGFCLVPGDLNHQPMRSHCSIGTGGTGLIAVKSGCVDNGEQGESSRGSQHLSSRMSMLQKSAPSSPKPGASSPLSMRKTCQSQHCSIALGQCSSTCNASAGSAQLRQNGTMFQRGVDYRPNGSCRLGLSETSNLTASERSLRNFDSLEEAMTSSLSRSFLSCNPSLEKMETGMFSGRVFNREGNWNGLDILNASNNLLNSSNRLPGLAHKSAWTGVGNDLLSDLEVGPSAMPMRTMLMNDAESQLIDFRTRDPATGFDGSFVALDSMAEDLFEQGTISSSESLFYSSLMVNQRSQEQISLQRRTADYVDHSPVNLGRAVNVTRPLAFKDKSFAPGTASQFAGQRSLSDIYSAGYASIEDGRPSVETRASMGRHNLGMSGRKSVFDAPTSTFSSYTGEVSEQHHNLRSIQGRSIGMGQDSARVRRLAEPCVASNSGRVVYPRNICNGTGVLPYHQNLLSTSLPPNRACRRTISATEADTLCRQRVLGGDTVVESELGSSSGICTTDQTSIPLNRLRGLNPPSLRGRNSIGALQRRYDTNIGAANTVPTRHVRRTSRCMSSSLSGGRLVGRQGLDNRLNGSTDLTGSLDSLLLEDEISNNASIMSGLAPLRPSLEISNNASIISGLAPLRPSPLPPAVQFSRPQTNSSFSVSLPFSGSTSPQVPPPMLSPIAASLASAVDAGPFGVFDSSVFGKSASLSEIHRRPTVPYSEGVGQRPFQLQPADGENQSGPATNGFEEVLVTLEQIEQNEVLTYEHMLMLEETLLVSGISLHDQHSAMRLDIDNMSYEELLALEERIGNVSTGLDEETICKCLEKILYSSNTAVVSNNQEIEMKCSICQEEYEERDCLGRLQCGHSYHEACIKQWLVQKNKCPICKVSLGTF